MEYEWDPKKAADNLRRHKISFENASKVFDDPNRIDLLDKGNYNSSEVRYNTIGFVDNLLFVVYTERVDYNGIDVTRIISARKAN